MPEPVASGRFGHVDEDAFEHAPADRGRAVGGDAGREAWAALG